ncbi:OsmC family peroxiredoxin [Occultella kanbiaonis]|uniref:OsmC family peroxiredoxin n=1 Tax=Occultella kanbiaonis TaxID=2675754 RepID=UPI0012B852C9|nr:OsmC family peroxiredoxin [Occultella kanbiaonis]
MALVSRASASWSGNLFQGSGSASLDSSKLATFDINWKARTEENGGTTNPEELIGAAHAACYSMAFSNVLDSNGTPPTQINTGAKVTFDPGAEGGAAITGIHLTVSATVENLSEEDFQKLALAAKEGCPVSKALAGTEITLTASLA